MENIVIHDYYVAVRYMERDEDMPDIVKFSIPENVAFNSIMPFGNAFSLEAALCNDLDDAIECMEDMDCDEDGEEYSSREEQMEAIFDSIADKFGGTWGYYPILTKYIEV